MKLRREIATICRCPVNVSMSRIVTRALREVRAFFVRVLLTVLYQTELRVQSSRPNYARWKSGHTQSNGCRAELRLLDFVIRPPQPPPFATSAANLLRLRYPTKRYSRTTRKLSRAMADGLSGSAILVVGSQTNVTTMSPCVDLTLRPGSFERHLVLAELGH
jgi:hypothetical protein